MDLAAVLAVWQGQTTWEVQFLFDTSGELGARENRIGKILALPIKKYAILYSQLQYLLDSTSNNRL